MSTHNIEVRITFLEDSYTLNIPVSFYRKRAVCNVCIDCTYIQFFFVLKRWSSWYVWVCKLKTIWIFFSLQQNPVDCPTQILFSDSFTKKYYFSVRSGIVTRSVSSWIFFFILIVILFFLYVWSAVSLSIEKTSLERISFGIRV